jgi:hypothetical protein
MDSSVRKVFKIDSAAYKSEKRDRKDHAKS